MSAFKALRSLAGVVCLATGLLLLTASGTVAASPLIAPFIQQAVLFEEEAPSWERFNNGGEGVALSSYGNTALIGGRNAEWVYTRSGTTWTRQAKLNFGIGSSVALSGDGNTALIGEAGDNNQVGAAWVFTRTGSTWTQQGGKLTGGGEIGQGRFGTSVALASNGKTALIGGPGDNEGVGAAWVFTRSGSTWTEQGKKLTGTGESGQGRFGGSVALASHAKTALIGGPGDDTGIGAAWVFLRSGKTWTQQGEKLTGRNEIGNGSFGSGVALASDGQTALIGGSENDNSQLPGHNHFGVAWDFTRSGSTWTQQGDKLTGGGSYEGGCGVPAASSVALSSDGDTALIGDPKGGYCFGVASFFSRSGTTWIQQHVEGETPEHPSSFGTSVALSSDGNTALIGEPFRHDGGVGLVFVRVNLPTVKKVSPDRGPTGGGTTVTIHGTDFTGASAVKFGSTDATSFTVKSATEITAVAPAETAGTVNVTVTTPGGTSASGHFRFVAKHRHKGRHERDRRR